MSRKKLLLQKIRSNKLAAIEYILSWGIPNFIPYGEPHKAVIKACEKVRMQKELVKLGKLDPKETKEGVIIQFCRDHSKTTLTLGYILTLLGENPNLRIKIVCESEQMARQRIKFLKAHLERNPRLKQLYPNLKPADTESWSSQQLYVERDLISPDPSIEAYGVLSAATGSHCVLPDTSIITNKGLKPIKDIQLKDLVLSRDGKFEQVVVKASHIYKGKVYYIKTSPTIDAPFIKITADHKILVKDIEDTNTGVMWLKAETIAKQPWKYLLAFPKPHSYEEEKVLVDLNLTFDILDEDDNFYYVPIGYIEEDYYDGIVYDIQVLNEHSFCSPFALLRNCDLIVFDDIIGQRNAIVYPENLKKVEEAFYNTWLNVLNSTGGWFIYIFTPYKEGELSLKLKERTDLYEVVEYIVDDNLTPIWPEWMNREALKKKLEEIGPTAFARAYQGKVASDKDFVFNRNAIEQCYDFTLSFGETKDNWIYVMGVDLAAGRTKQSARNVIFTLAIDEKGHRIPVSIKIGRWDSVTTAKMILNEYERFKHKIIKIENNAYQQALIDWINAISGSIDLPIEGYRTGNQKFDPERGLPSMAAEFEKGLWRIPMKDEHPDGCDCPLCVWLEELKTFPHSKFSDTVMASFFAREAAREIVGNDTVNISFIDVKFDEDIFIEQDETFSIYM